MSFPEGLLQHLRHVLAAAAKSAGAGRRIGVMPEQNLVVLSEMNVEQLEGKTDGQLGETTRRIVERDFGDLDGLKQAILSSGDVDWAIVGLAFSTYDFRVFSFKFDAAPFCVTPVMAICATQEAADAAGIARSEIVQRQLDTMSWGVVEARLRCLQEPLDLFAEPQACATKCSESQK